MKKILLAIFAAVLLGAFALVGLAFARLGKNPPAPIPILKDDLLGTPSPAVSANPDTSPTAEGSDSQLNVDKELKELDQEIDGADGSVFQESDFSEDALGF